MTEPSAVTVDEMISDSRLVAWLEWPLRLDANHPMTAVDIERLVMVLDSELVSATEAIQMAPKDHARIGEAGERLADLMATHQRYSDLLAVLTSYAQRNRRN